jgi:hypothetical protein
VTGCGIPLVLHALAKPWVSRSSRSRLTAVREIPLLRSVIGMPVGVHVLAFDRLVAQDNLSAEPAPINSSVQTIMLAKR